MAENDDVKAQDVRVMDVIFLGPMMIIASTMVKDPYMKVTLAVGGLGTVVYNAVNHARIEARKRRARREARQS